MLAAGGIALLGGVLVAVGGFAQTGLEEADGGQTASAALGPDVVVFGFHDGIQNYGSADGYTAYAIGTVSCNRGDAPLNWCPQSGGSTCAPPADNDDHPVIAQNLYRLEDGRFEQIGMSWLKHGFASLNQTVSGCTGAGGATCAGNVGPYYMNVLGVGCTDPYTSWTNGNRPWMGPHSEVNGTTGALEIPHSVPPTTNLYDGRVKVASSDVDPLQNPGALYWAESQYIAADDAASGNGLNNASHQQVTVGVPPSFPLTVTGAFFEQQPALRAWRAQDASVLINDVDLPGSIVERFQAARKVTALGGGLWRYEFAIRNHNSDRSARSFKVEFPLATTFTDIGFHDVEHHSGEPYATTDWSQTTTASAVTWSTDTFEADPDANALRFGAMFNFRFDADRPPEGAIQHLLGLFKPGDPAAVALPGFHDLFADGFDAGTFHAWSGHS